MVDCVSVQILTWFRRQRLPPSQCRPIPTSHMCPDTTGLCRNAIDTIDTMSRAHTRRTRHKDMRFRVPTLF
jgi:hypothetical protein